MIFAHAYRMRKRVAQKYLYRSGWLAGARIVYRLASGWLAGRWLAGAGMRGVRWRGVRVPAGSTSGMRINRIATDRARDLTRGG